MRETPALCSSGSTAALDRDPARRGLRSGGASATAARATSSPSPARRSSRITLGLRDRADLSVDEPAVSGAPARPKRAGRAGREAIGKLLDRAGSSRGGERDRPTGVNANGHQRTSERRRSLGYQVDAGTSRPAPAGVAGDRAAVAEASAKLVASGIPLQAQPLQYVLHARSPTARRSCSSGPFAMRRTAARSLLARRGGSLGKLRGVDVGVVRGRRRRTRPRSATTASTTPGRSRRT